MAIVLKNNYYDITIDSNTIIGVMGKDYDKFLKELAGEDIYYLDKIISFSTKKVCNLFNVDDSKLFELLKEFDLTDEILSKKINELSHGEQKLIKYILLVLSEKKINVIDEPFIDLDYNNKKTVMALIKRLIRDKKTVIVGSVNSNIIYELCKKVLFIDGNNYYYDDISVFQKNNVLKKYHIDEPNLVQFVNLAKNKKIKIRYSYDIRDLIKDVYRNVSQK